MLKLNYKDIKYMINESVKKLLSERHLFYGNSNVSIEEIYNPWENEPLLSMYDEGDINLRDDYHITLSGDYSWDEGDYYTPPYDEISSNKVEDDDGFMNDVEMIQDENLKQSIIDSFDEWAENVMKEHDFSDEHNIEPDFDDYD